VPRRGLCEVPDDESGDLREHATHPQLRQHSVEAIGWLADVLEHEKGAAIVGGVRRARERGEEREVATDEPAVRASGAHGARAVRHATRIATLDHGADERSARKVGERDACGGSVVGDELAAGARGGMQGGDVREAEQRARPAGERCPVDVRQQAHGAVSSSHTPHGVDVLIGQRGIEIPQPFGIRPTEISVTAEHVGAGLRFPAERARIRDGGVELFRATQRAGRRDERDARTGGEQWRKSHRAQRRERCGWEQWVGRVAECGMRGAECARITRELGTL